MDHDHKDIAFLLAELFDMLGHTYPKQIESDMKVFMAGCKTYIDDAAILREVAFYRRTGIIETSNDLTQITALLKHTSIPDAIRREMHERIKAASKPKFAPVKVSKPPTRTRLYLMKNLRSGYCKIGSSDNPRYRESTLQSQEPEIILLFHWSGTRLDEERLQQQFHKKRVRGEWFNLHDNDVAEIRDSVSPYDVVFNS